MPRTWTPGSGDRMPGKTSLLAASRACRLRPGKMEEMSPLAGATFQGPVARRGSLCCPRRLGFAARPWRAPVVPSSGLGRRPPERLLIAPQDIRTSDPTLAADIYAGYFAFGGKIVNAHGRSPSSSSRYRRLGRGRSGGFWLAAAFARRRYRRGARQCPRPGR